LDSVLRSLSRKEKAELEESGSLVDRINSKQISDELFQHGKFLKDPTLNSCSGKSNSDK